MPLFPFHTRCVAVLASLALLSATFDADADAAAGLPDTAEIEAAFKRAAAGEPLPDNLLLRAMVDSVRVDEVAGCAPMDEQLWCIVTMGGGFKFEQRRVLALTRQDGRWMLIPGHDDSLPPSPPPRHAQMLMRELAGKTQADGETMADLHRAATELEVISVHGCNLVPQDGNVSCELDYRLHRAAPATTIDIQFLLNGELWQLADQG